MTKQFLFKIIFILFVPIITFATNIEETPVKLIKKDDMSISNTNTVDKSLTTPVQADLENTNSNLTEIEKQIALQNKILEDTITNINNETYLNSSTNTQEYEDETTFLINRININKREKNLLAVKRDELKLLLLKQKKAYEDTLKAIIIGKDAFKDKQYFQDLIQNNIKNIEESNIESYTSVYEQEQNNDNNISKELVNNYIELYN